MMAAKLRALTDRMSGKPSEGEAARYRPEIDARFADGFPATIEATA